MWKILIWNLTLTFNSTRWIRNNLFKLPTKCSECLSTPHGELETYEKILNEELKKFGGGEEWKKVLLEDPTALAVLIAATDPTGFKIEAVFRKEEEVVLNGDIEYCYVITTGSEGVFIEIYTPEDDDRFWRTGDPKLLKRILPPTPFTEEEVKKVLG